MKGMQFGSQKSLVTYILTWPSPSSATRGRCPNLTIRALRMLLLYVGIQGWIAKVSFYAILAFEVSTFHIVLRSPLSLVVLIFCAVLVVVILFFVNQGTLWLDLLGSDLVKLVWHLHILQLSVIWLHPHRWNLLHISVIHRIPLHHLPLAHSAIRHVVYRKELTISCSILSCLALVHTLMTLR